MQTKKNLLTLDVLHEWRASILNTFLIVVAFASAVMTIVSITDAVSRPGQWPPVILYSALALLLTVLAIFRHIDIWIRAWSVLLVAYVVGVIALASYGLGSSGRLYLLVLPIGALILIGVRSAVFMSAISTLTMFVFTVLANYGVLTNWLVSERNSLNIVDWMAEDVDLLMLLVTVMALLIMFYRFQERLIEKERRSQLELKDAQELLEEQNANLEQKVKEHTEELRATNSRLEKRNEELTILNSLSAAMTKSLDVKVMTHIVGDQLRVIFDSDTVSILLVDAQQNLIHT